MIGKTPFDLSEKESVNNSKSLIQGSPSKNLLSSPSKNLPPTPKSRRDNDEFPTEMQYRLEKVFEEAREREEKYVNIIK